MPNLRLCPEPYRFSFQWHTPAESGNPRRRDSWVSIQAHQSRATYNPPMTVRSVQLRKFVESRAHLPGADRGFAHPEFDQFLRRYQRTLVERQGWQELINRWLPGNSIVVAFLVRYLRDLEEGLHTPQANPAERNTATIAVEEDTNTNDDSTTVKYIRRSMLPRGA